MLQAALVAATIAMCPAFPPSFSTNQRIDKLPVAPDSDAIVGSIGREGSVHPDFGSGTWDGQKIGIPLQVVPHSTKRSKVAFDYSGESDHVGYPIPKHPRIEGGSDRHALIVDKESCRLYELFALRKQNGRWHAGSGATWSLRSTKLRPRGWTSADAAGLPILPLLARWYEVRRGAIHHALRVTVARTRDAYVYPARHAASNSGDPSLPRMGERLRLKKSADIRHLGPQARIVARAMQQYGLIVADNGSNWYVSGAPDAGWNNDDLHTLGMLKGSNFEVVDVKQ